MRIDTTSSLAALRHAVQEHGFCFATGAEMQPLLALQADSNEWQSFAQSWNRLEPDTYLAATGRHRRRRHATYLLSAEGTATLQAHRAHFQTLHYNQLQGDLERWFEPIEPAIAHSQVLQSLLHFCNSFFGPLAPTVPQWHVEVHQFRIEAANNAAGEPTPEGSHRDGVDFVLVMLIDRQNIASGTTTIHTPQGEPLGSFTLTRPLDAALIHDPRVFHGVTPVHAVDPEQAAHRDVLVMTLRAADVSA